MSERRIFETAQRWVKLIVEVRKKSPNAYYLAFARLGVGIILLGVTPWFPGFWEQIAEWVASIFMSKAEETLGLETTSLGHYFVWRIIVSAACILGGFTIVIRCLSAFEQGIANAGPSTINDGAVSFNIQEGTDLGGFLGRAAEGCEVALSTHNISQSTLDQKLVKGPISGDSFLELLESLSERTSPPLSVTWEKVSDDFYTGRETTDEGDETQ